MVRGTYNNCLIHRGIGTTISTSIDIITLYILLLGLFNPSPTNAMLNTGFNVSFPDYLFNGIIPPTFPLPASCAAAYSSTIACDRRILISPNLSVMKAESLGTACDPKLCAHSILMYEERVKRECGMVDLASLGLNGTWLEFVVSGMAGVAVYWKNCLRDMDTNELCLISQADYELAWNAATADSPNSAAVKAFCSDNCLTQTIVLNVGSQENLNELERMCGESVNIPTMPFIEHMVFAGLLKLSNSTSEDNDGDGDVVFGMDRSSPVPIVPVDGVENSALGRSRRGFAGGGGGGGERGRGSISLDLILTLTLQILFIRLIS